MAVEKIIQLSERYQVLLSGSRLYVIENSKKYENQAPDLLERKCRDYEPDKIVDVLFQDDCLFVLQ